MKKTFLAVLVASAALQFVVTRKRAGEALEEGAAEAMWLRYPLDVLLNAAIWTLALSLAAAAIRTVRRAF